jgi:hypothetical protein
MAARLRGDQRMADGVTFEVYKLLVEDVREARRARRELSNIFLTLNLAGIGALGLIAQENGDLDPALFALLTLALATTCAIWQTSMAYYTRVLKAKYEVIGRYEDEIGHAPLRDEYNAMGRLKAMRSFTLERIMPLLFVFAYVVFFIVQTIGVAELLTNMQTWFGNVLSQLGAG